jgi:hypothetical protein
MVSTIVRVLPIQQAKRAKRQLQLVGICLEGRVQTTGRPDSSTSSWREIVINLRDRSRTLHRDREHFLGRFRVNPHDFALAYELNRATKLAAFNGHDETHWSVTRDREGSFQQQATDANIPAHAFELNHQVSGVNFETYRILQAEATMLALWQRR